MNKKVLLISLILVCIALLAVIPMLSPPATASESIVPYVQNMIRSYRDTQDPNAKVIRDSLKKIEQIDPKAGKLWETIMEDWHRCNAMDIPADVLPDGLPEDNSLCIVTLGYALNADGTMQPELIERLQVALASAQKYPNAYIAVTGGGTAAKSDETEAEAMARWLISHGIDEDRLIIEKESLSTVYNAVNTYGILVREYPEVKGIAIVTSDYHVPWGATLFQTVCDYTEIYGKTVIPVIGCAANTTNVRSDTMSYQASGICTITGIPYKR